MVKIFPKESYEKTKYVPKKFRAVFDLFRPFTLLAPLLGGFSGALMALSYAPLTRFEGTLVLPTIEDTYPYVRWEFPLLVLIWGALTLVIVNAGSNALNQVYDYEIDRINKPYRPLPMGLVTLDEARSIAWVLYLVTLWRAATFGLGAFGVLVLIIMLFTIFYSVPPLRLKEHLWLSNISIALARGLLGFVAAWCIFGSPFDPTPWIIGGVMALFLVGAITTKDFTDIEGDRKFNSRTLPVVYGIRRSVTLSAPFFVVPFFLIPLAIYFGLLIPNTIWLTGLSVYGLYITHLLYRFSLSPDERFENTKVWVHMYILLITIQLGFCLTYVLS